MLSNYLPALPDNLVSCKLNFVTAGFFLRKQHLRKILKTRQ